MILVEAEKLWNYCMEKRDYLTYNFEKVAESPDTQTEVMVAVDGSAVMLSVVSDGYTVHETDVYTPDECEEAAASIYKVYIECDEEPNVDNAAISDNEDILSDAVYEFMQTLLDMTPQAVEALVAQYKDDILDGFIASLSKYPEIMRNIYRPMILEDESGNELYTAFPYRLLSV